METVFVKPKENLLVRSPRTKTPIPKEGANVTWIGPDGRYWRRRVRDGDVEITKPIKEEVNKSKDIPKGFVYDKKENGGEK